MFDRGQFLYISSMLICGDNSPRVARYKLYNLDIFKQSKDLGVKILKRGTEQLRFVSISNSIKLISDAKVRYKTNNFSPLLILREKRNNLSISDSIFNQEEFILYNKDINALIERKIKVTANLIESLYKKEMMSVPLLINDFPNICRALLDNPDIILG